MKPDSHYADRATEMEREMTDTPEQQSEDAVRADFDDFICKRQKQWRDDAERVSNDWFVWQAAYQAGRAHKAQENEKLRQQVVAQQARIKLLTLAVEAAEEQTDDEALRYGFKYALSIKDDLSALAAHEAELLEAKDAELAMLKKSLDRCLDDSREVLNEYIQKYSEDYKPHRLEYQRETILLAEQALSSTSDTWLNEYAAKVLEEAADKAKESGILGWWHFHRLIMDMAAKVLYFC